MLRIIIALNFSHFYFSILKIDQPQNQYTFYFNQTNKKNQQSKVQDQSIQQISLSYRNFHQLHSNLFFSKKMYRQNLIKFGIQIRRQNKLSLFKNLRRQHQQIQQIQRNIDELLNLNICRQNYSSFKNILREINENMVNICQKMTKSNKPVDYQDKNLQINVNESLPIQKLLTTSKFKLYLLEIFLSINQSRTKQNLNSFRQQDELEKQVVTLIGLLLKQPYFLQSYFPLMTFKNFNVNNQNNMLLNEEQQNLNTQQGIYMSFELLQQIIFYIKSKFTTINEILSDSKTFLALLHCITRILQHFTLNSKVQEIINKNMICSQNDNDTETLNFMYQILKSNNLQHNLKQLVLDIQENQNEKTTKTRIYDNMILDKKQLEQSVINLAICQIFSVYMDFVNKVRPESQYSKVFTNTILRFSQKCLKIVHFFNIQRYFYEFKQNTHFNEQKNDLKCYKELRQVSIRILFSLQSIISNSKIQPSNNIINNICMQIMIFLHNIRKNEGLKHKKGQKSSYQGQNNLNKNNNNIISPVQYYFDILVCEQENEWFSELQLLGCLFNLVFKHNVSLEQLFAYSLQQKSNQMQSFTILIDTKFVKSLFDTVGQDILILSGTFYNQRHLFMCTLAHLLCQWYENVQIYENKKKKRHQIEQEFNIQFMQNLGQIVINYLRQLKSSVTKNNQLLQISTNNHPIVGQQQTPIINYNMSILQSLTIIEDQMLDLLQRCLKNDIEIQI